MSCYMFFASSIELPKTDKRDRGPFSLNELLECGQDVSELEKSFEDNFLFGI